MRTRTIGLTLYIDMEEDEIANTPPEDIKALFEEELRYYPAETLVADVELVPISLPYE